MLSPSVSTRTMFLSSSCLISPMMKGSRSRDTEKMLSTSEIFRSAEVSSP